MFVRSQPFSEQDRRNGALEIRAGNPAAPSWDQVGASFELNHYSS